MALPINSMNNYPKFEKRFAELYIYVVYHLEGDV